MEGRLDRLCEANDILDAQVVSETTFGRNGTVRQTVPKDPFFPHVISRKVSRVKPEVISWIWQDRIPERRLSLLAGDGGVGKSFLTLDIAARLSRGMPWPDRPDEYLEAGTTLIINAEDDPSDTLRPRLDKAGANCERVFVIDGVQRVRGGNRDFAIYWMT